MINFLKPVLLKSVLTLLKYIKVHRLISPVMAGNGLILVLHRAVPATGRMRIKANSRIEVTPEFLEELILFFRSRNYEIISLDELYETLTENKKRRPFVCFTFDDGYADAHEIVYPLFKKHQAPFAVYVITSFPDRTAILWWYMLEELVLRKENLSFSRQGREYFFKTGNMAEKEKAYNAIRQMIMAVPRNELGEWLERVFSPHGISAHDYQRQQMDWQQVRELSNEPLVTIGAHTVNHLNLRQLGPEEVRREIESSKKILEEKTGNPVDHFAYPFGSRAEVGSREFAIGAKCGFKTMKTVR